MLFIYHHQTILSSFFFGPKFHKNTYCVLPIRCYVWFHGLDNSRKRRFFAGLHRGPVDSPQAAVRVAVVSELRKASKNKITCSYHNISYIFCRYRMGRGNSWIFFQSDGAQASSRQSLIVP